MRKTFNYSYDYYNPAPIATIVLQTLDKKRATKPLEALIDSGADTTIVPLHYLSVLKLNSKRSGHIISQWGEPTIVKIYRVHVLIGDMKIQAMEVAGDPIGNDVIVGRNVLNKLKVVLDGLGEVVEIDDYS